MITIVIINNGKRIMRETIFSFHLNQWIEWAQLNNFGIECELSTEYQTYLAEFPSSDPRD